MAEVAIRNAAGFTCAVVLGTLLSSPATGVVAGLGALNVAYSDGRDPYALRTRRMLIWSLVSGVAVILGALSGHSNVTAITLAAISAFAAGMLVALGTTAGDLGVITVVTLVIFAARPLPFVEALEAGAVAMGGGLLQALLSAFLWPIRRYEPEKRIVAGIYGELAEIARTPPEPATAPPMTKQISDAQDALSPLARDHGMEAERLVFLLVQAERIRLSILNTNRLRRRIARDKDGDAAAGFLGEILRCASDSVRPIGHLLRDGSLGSTNEPLERLTAAVIQFQTLTIPRAHAFLAALLRDARHQSDALRVQVAAATGASSGTQNDPYPLSSAPPETRVQESWRLHFEGWRARLLANFSLDSTVFRHAVRLAVCLAIGAMIARIIGLQRAYWIPMTIAIVLKPDFTGTFSRGVLRIAGTLVGLVLATVLFRFVHTGVAADIALMTIFTLVLRLAGPANYGIFVIAMSGLVVLLVAVTGVAPESVIGPRALNTAIGGALALFTYAVWPTWEKTQTRSSLADMLDSYRAYFHAVIAAYRGGPASAIDSIRVRGRRARSNAVASADRMSGEPGVTAAQVAAINAILVHSHSFVYAVMAMESRLYRHQQDPAPRWMCSFAESAERMLAGSAAMLRNPVTITASNMRRSRHDDVETPLPGTGASNGPLETEADRIRTSLRSLNEEIIRRCWL